MSKNTRSIAAACAIALILPSASQAGIALTISAPYAPPLPRTENHSPAPYQDAVWIDGRWGWNDGRYVWNSGHWEHRQSGMHGWHRGDWRRQGSVWVWHPGKWF